MSRLKLFLLVLIVAALGIVFVQNREPLVLKLLCPDRTQVCLYRTPQLPLAVWIAVFTLGGVVTSLLVQLLDRYRYSGTAKRKYVDNDLKSDRPYGYDDDRPKQHSRKGDGDQDTTIYTTSADYEKPQEPQSVERSGSTYSYKYKDKQEDNNNVQKTPVESDINLNKDDNDEDWI